MALDDYDPSTALSAYFPSRDERRTARLWATEKLLHDLKAVGIIDFFEGPGSDPTALDGYASNKIWLRVASGVTDEPGEIRRYDGVGDEDQISNWPELSAAGMAAYIPDAFSITQHTSDNITEGSTKLLMTVSERQQLAGRTANVTITVGTGGDYATINEALEAASRRAKAIYETGGVEFEISLLTGFVMAEQVIVESMDLSYCKITSVDAEVVITRSALTTQAGYGTEPSYPAFAGLRTGKLPRIDCLFNMDGSGTATGRTFIYLEEQGRAVVGENCGCKNAGGRGIEARDQSFAFAKAATFTGAGSRGFYAVHGGIITAELADVSDCAGDIAVYALHNSHIDFRAGVADDAAGIAIFANDSSVIDAPEASANGALGDRAVFAQRNSRVSFYQGSAQNATTEGLRAAFGSHVMARQANLTGSASALSIGPTSSIDATGITGATASFPVMYDTLIGGDGTTTLLTIKQTTGNGASGGIAMAVGNNGATEAFRVDTSGRFLKGTTTSQAVGGSQQPTQFYGAGGSGITIGRLDNGAFAAAIRFLKSRNTAPGSFTIVQDGDAVGEITWCADDGTDYASQVASISAAIDGTPGANDVPGRLVFLTTADGAAAATESMRLTSAKNLKIGGTASRGTTEGANQIVLFNGTAPVGTLSNGVSFYSASGEARVMDAAGNSTLLSPHDQKTNEWIYHSIDTRTGKGLRIDMERMMRAINEKFGWDFVKEFESKD